MLTLVCCEMVCISISSSAPPELRTSERMTIFDDVSNVQKDSKVAYLSFFSLVIVDGA